LERIKGEKEQRQAKGKRRGNSDQAKSITREQARLF
jgi:hypothetical protein